MKKYLLLIVFTVMIFSIKSIAQNTELWATTAIGGNTHGGTIFKINEDGTGFQILNTFNNKPTGDEPLGNLLKANNGNLYGMTVWGGETDTAFGFPGYGTIFSFNPLGNIYSDLMNFDVQSGNQPIGSFIQAINGKLYGMTLRGGDTTVGNNGGGTLINFDPSNNSFDNLFTFNDTSGAGPYGSLLQANDGKLYGMTNGGGDTSINSYGGYGVIFSYDIISNTYTRLYNFNNANGANPYGSLIQATNGLLYGMTYYGGPDSNHWGNNNFSTGAGVIFSFDITNNAYIVVHYFDSAHGALPSGSLMQANNGLLYGMTGGALGNNGNIFSLDPSTNTFTDLHDFNFADGSSPYGDLIQASNGKLYGMTSAGGDSSIDFPSGLGVIFNYDITNNTYTKMMDFDNPGNPYGSFIELPAGTGINEVQSKNELVSVFPNPANTILTIHLSSSIINGKLSIENVLGEEIYKQSLLNIDNTIDVSKWSEGVYFITIRNEDSITTQKFIKL